LPKDKKDLQIIDLGAGDGRLYKFLAPLKPARYVACDIAEKLLKKHPLQIGGQAGTNIEKIVCDLEDTLPFDDESFDLATSFFVLEHIEDVNSLFAEVYRILKS
jgi:ubiquinone/menaquinone biosynthesis C-methylase UbiE